MLLPAGMKMSKKAIAVSVISILIVFLVKNPLYGWMGVQDAPQLKFFSLANDMMYSYYKGDPVSEEVREIVYKITSGDPAHYDYHAYYVKYNALEPAGYTVLEFIKIYMENVIRNPGDSIMAVLLRTTDIWSIVKPNDEMVNIAYYTGEYISPAENLWPRRQDNLLTVTLTGLCGWITGNSVLYVLYWRTGIWHLLIFLLSGICCAKAGKKERLLYILPFVPVLFHILALAATAGWSDYRYFWPGMTISLLLLCYLAITGKKEECHKEAP